jgi:hypothetical protein
MSSLMPRWCQPHIMMACMAVTLIASILMRSVILFKTGMVIPLWFFVGLMLQAAIRVSSRNGKPVATSLRHRTAVFMIALLPVAIIVWLWIVFPTPWGQSLGIVFPKDDASRFTTSHSRVA